MNLAKSLLLCGLLAGASMQAMACYTVYDSANRVAYQGEQAPVDMSLPLREALAQRFAPGSSMVFDNTTTCPSIVTASKLAPAPGGSTLITDQRTAQAMNAPYKPAMGGLVVVRPRDARMRPGVSIVPAQVSARPQFEVIRAPGTNMITELRDPPMTVVSQLAPG